MPGTPLNSVHHNHSLVPTSIPPATTVPISDTQQLQLWRFDPLSLLIGAGGVSVVYWLTGAGIAIFVIMHYTITDKESQTQ